jgi:hypothetical protein
MTLNTAPANRLIRVREIAGIFQSRRDAEAAIDALLLSGFDRADIDLLGDIEVLHKRLKGVRLSLADLADAPFSPRRPFVAKEDITITGAMAVGIPAFLAAAAGAAAAIAADGTLIEAIISAAVLGVAAGAPAAVLISNLDWMQERLDRATEREAGGVIVWIRIHLPELESKAQEILLAHGAKAVRVHEIDLASTQKNLPTRLQPQDQLVSDQRPG